MMVEKSGQGEKSDKGASAVNVESYIYTEATEATEDGSL